VSHSGDRLVDAKAILEALSELKRRGNKTLMAELESIEPELAGHAMEELSLIYQGLSGPAPGPASCAGCIARSSPWFWSPSWPCVTPSFGFGRMKTARHLGRRQPLRPIPRRDCL